MLYDHLQSIDFANEPLQFESSLPAYYKKQSRTTGTISVGRRLMAGFCQVFQNKESANKIV
jgi:hypothetical protein